jgi:phasin
MQDMPNFAELPESIRNIMKSSIEQARKAFDAFATSSEKMIQTADASAIPGADALKQLNERLAAFTRKNAESNFNFALQLTEARHLSEIVELQNTHLRTQMETFSRQLEELRELSMKAVKDGAKAATATVQNAASSIPQNPFLGG